MKLLKVVVCENFLVTFAIRMIEKSDSVGKNKYILWKN